MDDDNFSKLVNFHLAWQRINEQRINRMELKINAVGELITRLAMIFAGLLLALYAMSGWLTGNRIGAPLLAGISGVGFLALWLTFRVLGNKVEDIGED